MKVSELIEILEEMPQDAEVLMHCVWDDADSGASQAGGSIACVRTVPSFKWHIAWRIGDRQIVELVKDPSREPQDDR
jgi:hypothetical protein